MSDSVLDTVYFLFDELLLAERFEDADNLIFMLLKANPTVALGVLTITLPAKSKLKHRRTLYLNQKDWYIKNNRDLKILEGLE